MNMIKRFGISRGVSPREDLKSVGEAARICEDNGFEVLWFIDHQLGMKDVYAAMNVAAMNTGKIEIGSAVTNLVTRHPTVTANATTALDELSDGRALLGLGAGWIAVHSIGRDQSRMADIRKWIPEFRHLFSGEKFDLDGTNLQLATARRQIPIYLAASQPRMLEISGELCDGTILMGAADPDFCKWQLEYIYKGLEKTNRERKDFTIDLFITASIDDDIEQALSDVRAWATSQAAQFPRWKELPAEWEKYRDEFILAREKYEFKDHLSLRAKHKSLISDDMVQNVALAGNLDYCVRRLREIAKLDIDRITFALLSGGRKRRIDQLANEVIPALLTEN